jgi:SPP1 gp7 family putative phage head morphogenesis protein
MAADDNRGNPFARVRNAEAQYRRQLGPIARTIGQVIGSYGPEVLIADPGAVAALMRELSVYAEMLGPWGRRIAERMVADVERRNLRAWKSHSADISRLLRREILETPVGGVYQNLVEAQVGLIKGLPIDAGERIQHLTVEAMLNGSRASEIAKEIMRSGEVSASSAARLARTQVGTSSTALVEARAVAVGSPGYIWRTSRDGSVRESHRRMEGKFVPWAQRPELEGRRVHAGEDYNCRCHPEPVLPKL